MLREHPVVRQEVAAFPADVVDDCHRMSSGFGIWETSLAGSRSR